MAKAETVVVPGQINGKLRARLTVAGDASEEQMRELALADQHGGEVRGGKAREEIRGRGRPPNQHRGVMTTRRTLIILLLALVSSPGKESLEIPV